MLLGRGIGLATWPGLTLSSLFKPRYTSYSSMLLIGLPYEKA